MSIGFPPSKTGLDQLAGSILVSLRSNMHQVEEFNASIQYLGSAGLIALGYSAPDAAMLLTIFANLDSIRLMAEGSPYSGPPLPFNFVAQTVPAWGGN